MRRRVSVTILVCASILGLLSVLLLTTPGEQATAGGSPASVFPLAAERLSANSPVFSLSKPEGAPLRGQPTAPHLSLATLDDLLDSWSKLFGKALLNTEELEARREFLSNKHLLERAYTALLGSDETRNEPTPRDRRMRCVDLLSDALNWNDNPEREFVAELVEQILTDGLVLEKQDRLLRKTLTGDRVELFQAMRSAFPERAAKLLEHSKGTRLEKLMAYASGHY